MEAHLRRAATPSRPQSRSGPRGVVVALAGLVTGALGAATGAGTLAAQAEVAPGAPVRVTHAAGYVVEGRLRSEITADPLLLTVEGSPLQVAASDVRRVEVGTERSSGQGFLRGAGIGALAGAGVGVLTGLVGSAGGPGGGIGSAGVGVAIVTPLAAGAGALVGGLLGAASPGVRWREVRPGTGRRGGVVTLAWRVPFP